MKSQALADFDMWSSVDYIGLSLIVIFGILICILIIWLFYRFNKSNSNVMNELSLRYNGKITKGNLIKGEQTGLKFQYKDFIISISSAYKSKGETSYTQVETQIHPIKEINLFVFSKSPLNYLNQWLNIAEKWKIDKIDLGFSDFNNAYTVKCSDGLLAHNLITMDIQNKLIDFKKYNPNVLVDESTIKIRCPFVFNREQHYTGLLEIIFLFCNRFIELNLASAS
jgi:hypothetical protein